LEPIENDPEVLGWALASPIRQLADSIRPLKNKLYSEKPNPTKIN
jgi:hypothetical protein